MGTTDLRQLVTWVQALRRRAAGSVERLRSSGALRRHVARELRGYVAAVVGVTLVSLLIAFVQRFVHVSNISLLYLFVVLYLARRFGRLPAVLASLLAFLAYDFLFIPPLYVFTVADPAQWVSLAALLMTSLVLGELTSIVEARWREAVTSQQRTATLYALAQLIASTRGEQSLLDALARRVVEVFKGYGVEACALILPAEGEAPVMRASAPSSREALLAAGLEAPERKAAASEVLANGESQNGSFTALDDGILRDVYWRYVPLRSGARIVGVLAIAGGEELQGLRVAPTLQRAGAITHFRQERRAGPRHHEATPLTDESCSADEPDSDGSAQAALFAAFCDQIALALERAELRREAIHAEALRESDKLKTALLGSVTHDLRTPLAAIKAATGILLEQREPWSIEDLRELLESIDASVDRLDRLVSNLLDLSRLEGGAQHLEQDWYPIGDVLATVLDQLDLVGHTPGRQIEVDMPPDLPLVLIDYRQMEEVFTNLVENAIKYSPEGSTIRVSARVPHNPPRPPLPLREGDAGSAGYEVLEVRVADQGIGIPSAELEVIFDKFYRVQHVRLPWANRPPIGTGLGLAICAGIIRAHGGSIWAESSPGKGATFIFTLPIPAQHPEGSLPEVGRGDESQVPYATDSAGTPWANGPGCQEETTS